MPGFVAVAEGFSAAGGAAVAEFAFVKFADFDRFSYTARANPQD
ncbi:MAG: hypothetical protein ABI901_00240 [Roseiflexaceae bacterium]